MNLNPSLATHFARIALGHVGREYPHKLDQVLSSDGDLLPPRTLHPIFFGSFDWHSCVHGWWTLLTLHRLFPDLATAAEIAALADRRMTVANGLAERAYLDRPLAAGFERPYGWAWLLALHHEACRHENRGWAAALQPLADAIADRFMVYLSKLTYPITVGTHANTAFALVLAREWSLDRRPALTHAIDLWAMRTFGEERDYRGWEPGGDDFLSPALTAALLMSRVMEPSQFTAWFDRFLPEPAMARFQPVEVSDRSDGKIAHLDGLNLSRSWCMFSIAAVIAPSPRVAGLNAAGQRHLDAALPHVAGDYAGEHWLATFALLALCRAPVAPR
ncbi:DUF2891 domain-containing protein [Novosphingobium sp.]|uniref:DUF2891 domain-containing protein n=1 Tax=Novosphingobium sp. TaxID=1874826 RepID=UPI0033408010